MTRLLSEVERTVLDYMAIGLTDREIAAATDCSVSTVKSRVCRILDKLQAVNRAHAVYIAFRRNLLSRTREITVPQEVVDSPTRRNYRRPAVTT